jgi:hypothetical protein
MSEAGAVRASADGSEARSGFDWRRVEKAFGVFDPLSGMLLEIEAYVLAFPTLRQRSVG